MSMQDILSIALLVFFGAVAFVAGWCNCKSTIFSGLKKAYEKREKSDDESYNKGWLECINFIMIKSRFFH